MIPLSQAAPDSSFTADHGQLLLHVSVCGFTQLSVVDQRQMIKEMLSMNEVKGIVIETPAEADEKDFRMKTFTELFDKLPQFCRVVFFQELTRKFFQSELVCWFRHLHSNDQQELIENMLDDGKYSRGGDVGYNNIMLGMELKFRKPLWKALKHCSSFRLRIFKDLVPTFPWYWEGFSRLWELPGNEEMNNVRRHQSHYAEFFLVSSIICIKAEGAHDQSELLFENSECDITQNLPDEREEDFRVRRFTEKFTKLNIPSQRYVVSQLFDLSSHTPPQVEEQDKRKAGKNLFFSEITKIGKRVFCSLKNTSWCQCCNSGGEESSAPQEWEFSYLDTNGGGEEYTFALQFAGPGLRGEESSAPQFIKVKRPDLRGGGETATTQGGAGSRGHVRNHMHAIGHKLLIADDISGRRTVSPINTLGVGCASAS